MRRAPIRISLTIPVIAAVLLSACGETPKAAFTRNCTEIMTVMMETMLKSESVPLNARPAVEKATADLCACRTNSIAALDGVSDAEKDLYYRDGLEAEGVLPQSRPLFKAVQDKCGEAFADALAAAVNEAKGES